LFVGHWQIPYVSFDAQRPGFAARRGRNSRKRNASVNNRLLGCTIASDEEPCGWPSSGSSVRASGRTPASADPPGG